MTDRANYNIVTKLQGEKKALENRLRALESKFTEVAAAAAATPDSPRSPSHRSPSRRSPLRRSPRRRSPRVNKRPTPKSTGTPPNSRSKITLSGAPSKRQTPTSQKKNVRHLLQFFFRLQFKRQLHSTSVNDHVNHNNRFHNRIGHTRIIIWLNCIKISFIKINSTIF